ncbi:MAG TPA: SLBB domain-containing protein [Planctomycetaceae bacterium]|nr:SLBB domain-containing protein [Planctomycetaceae bacterium]
MTIRWSLIAVLVLATAPTAFAQPLPPKTIVWNQRNPQSEAYFGIVGEIARPGVYSAAAAQVTVQELIQRAGGFSRRGSPAVRIIRGGRSGQSVFVRPDGADVLAPNDLVVVDLLRDPRQPLSSPTNDRTDRNVWVALIGVSEHPEVVPINPDQAQLPNIMLMLGQSVPLAKAVRTILPPGLPQHGGQMDLLPNGSVLVFDRSLLVSSNLPLFDVPQPLSEPAPPSTIATPVSDPAISSMPRPQVDAQPVPFTVHRNEQIPASPASLPAPGSRFAPPPMLPPQLPTGTESPAVYAGPPVIVEPESNTEAELVGIPAVSPAPQTGFDLWQLLGIGGTVASLVGVALVSRQYLDRTPSDNAQMPAAIWNRIHQTPPLPPRRSFESAPITEVEDDSADLGDDELRELLGGRLAIETEAAEFPMRMELRVAIPKDHSETVYRLDDAEEQIDAPHFAARTALDPNRTFFTDAAADAPSVPAPHFRRRQSRTEAAAPAGVSPSAFDGSAIERALSQLQEGLKS